jgi:hypothetical protein
MIWPDPARVATQCDPLPSVDANFNEATAVFTGELTHVYDSSEPMTLLGRISHWVGWAPSNFDAGLLYRFKVKRSWKGVETSTADVINDWVLAGYAMHYGGEYLVYAYGPVDKLEFRDCSRTGEVSSAAEDLAFLSLKPELSLTSSGQFLRVFLVLVCALIAFLGFWEVRRRRMSRKSSATAGS